MSLVPRLAIAGAAQSRYSLRGSTARLEDMIFQTAAAALDDCGLKRGAVDNVVIAASDALDGRSISSMLTAHAAGGYLKDEIKTSDEGSFALIVAILRLLSGEFHTSLVVSWSRTSEAPLRTVQGLAADPFFHRPFGLSDVSAAAMQANAYKSRFGVDGQAAARVVAKNRASGHANPLLDEAAEVTAAEVERSPYVAYPLRSLEIAPAADGVCALVLTTEERARDLKNRPVNVLGLGWATDTYYLGERDLTRFEALEKARARAYSMAGIGRPAEDIDVAEIYDATAWHELLACEALGFCGPGEAGDFVTSSRTVINPSGGCLSAYPVFSAGLTRTIEAYSQVAGRADGRQVIGARTALAHASAGFAGQSHAVVILGNR